MEKKKTMFKKAVNESAFLKCGILGRAGSGKSFSAMLISIGLHQFIKSKKPIFYLDSETSTDYLIDNFKEAKIELHVCKSRAFIDLLQSVDEAEKESGILIIDSITHFWMELMSAYQKKKNISRILLKDWMPIKQEWRQFSDRYIMSNLHIIMCGRAGDVFGFVANERGEKELQRTDTKMKVESETGYEPSLLLEIERVKKEIGVTGSNWIHRCWVLKDRFNSINGHHFDNPSFESFIPHIQKLNLGGKHKVLDTSKTSENVFSSERSMGEFYKQREIALEEIKDAITLLYPNRDAESQKAKIKLLQDVFKTSSWTKISDMNLAEVQEGLNKIKKIKPSITNGKNKKGGKK